MYDGEERRLRQEELLSEVAKRGALEAMKELGISEDDKESLRAFLDMIRGAKAGRGLLIWALSLTAGIGGLVLAARELFRGAHGS